MTTILATVFVLGVLVFLHELGHFLMAKLVGIRVERFSIGFPPRLTGKKIGDTDYCVSAIPLGGYVKLSGMVDESLDKETVKGEPWEFQSKPLPHKMATIFAGPFMNYLLAIVLFAGLIFFSGIPQISNSSRVGSITEGFPAAEAGISSGDQIVAVNGKSINSWEEMTQVIHYLPDKDISVEWVHNGETQSATLHTRAEKVPIDGDIKEIGLIGISPVIEGTKRIGIFTSLGYGVSQTWNLTKVIFISVKMLITGKESLRSLGGPVAIAKLAGESAETGFLNLLTFMAFLSINLAILNVLPIPALDGGHLLFLLIEGFIRRPISLKTRLVVQQIGMAVLFALIIFVIFNDIRNVFF